MDHWDLDFSHKAESIHLRVERKTGYMSSSPQNKHNRPVLWKLLHYGKCQALTLFSAFFLMKQKEVSTVWQNHSLTYLLSSSLPNQQSLQSTVPRVSTCERRVSGLHTGMCACPAPVQSPAPEFRKGCPHPQAI